MTMGAKARLRASKANTGQDRYGYQRVGDIIEIVPEKAKWVKQIFEWYVNRVPALKIRRRLIAANAPQKGVINTTRQIQWAKSSIHTILKAARDYALGVKIQSMAGETFEIPIPPIIDMETYERCLKVRAENKTHSANNLKRDYLIGGLLYCSCNRKWAARTDNRIYGRKHGGAERKTPRGRYFCPEVHVERIHPDCPRDIGSKKADEYVWARVCEAINEPEILITQARKFVDELRSNADVLHEDKERLQKELDALIMEWQWVITQARKGSINESDMDYQLGALTMQEISIKRDLASLGQAKSINALIDWETRVSEYLADLIEGIESLNATPQDDDDRQEIFELKRQTVLNLVGKATIRRNREIKLHVRLDLLNLLRGENGEIKNSGICAAQRGAGAHSRQRQSRS